MFRIPKTKRKEMRRQFKEAHDVKLQKQLEAQEKGMEKILNLLSRFKPNK